MIELGFGGWFQCRLATDPDPFDEPRGVSGYVRAYANEPDLDRIIRFQSPPFERSHAPAVGVRVNSVVIDGASKSDHGLIGAAVNLLGDPVFEGRNGVVAEDAYEPIWPFLLSVEAQNFRLRRGVVAKDPDYPFPEFLATPGGASPDQIGQATGVADLGVKWRERAQALAGQLEGNAAEPDATALRERLQFLNSGRGLEFFNASMSFDYALRSAASVEDPANILGARADLVAPWNAQFWLGAWDADALCGFAKGALRIPVEGAIETFSARSVRRANVGSLHA